MNIFVLDRDPFEAARLMCDKHVVKMVVETAQLLSTAHRVLDGELTKKPSVSGKRMVTYYEFDDYEAELIYYKAAHIKHPCAIWCRETTSNYEWLYEHFQALCEQYKKRYDKWHKTDIRLMQALRNKPLNLKPGPLTEFPQAMPDDCKQEDVVLAYRSYYNKYKSDFAKWKSGFVPEWFEGALV